MDTGSLIVDIVIILVIAIPLAYLVIYSFNRERKVKKSVAKLCSQKGINLGIFEINGNLVLGIDDQQKKLILTHRKDTNNAFQIIDLPQLTDCQVKTVKHSKITLDWVGLELVGTQQKQDIAFYVEEDDEDPGTSAEICLQAARKWEKLIRPLLKAS